MHFQLSGQVVQALLLGTPFLVALIVFAGRHYFNNRNLHRWYATFWSGGLIIALGLALTVLNVTQSDPVAMTYSAEAFDDDILEMVPPPTVHPPKKTPPPPPPVFEEVPEEKLLDDEVFEFVDQSIDADAVVFNAPVAADPDPVAPPPPSRMDDTPEEPEIFIAAENMPAFPGCETIDDEEKRRTCTDRKLLQYIYSNLKYPPIARENGIEGTVVASFVIDQSGSVQQIKLVKDIGANCGEEVLDVLESLDTPWQPGRQQGRAVSVQFQLPVIFRLEK
jgi:periplasmic protein TonB